MEKFQEHEKTQVSEVTALPTHNYEEDEEDEEDEDVDNLNFEPTCQIPFLSLQATLTFGPTALKNGCNL